MSGLRADERVAGQVDVRLAVGAVAAWLGVSVGLGWPAGRVLALGLGAGGLGCATLATGRHLGRMASVLALGGFCVALALVPLAARLYRAHDSPLSVLARQRVATTAELTVTADPRQLRAHGPAGAPRVAVDARVTSLRVGARMIRASGNVVILAPAAPWSEILPGQRVRVDAALQPPLGGGLLTATLSAQSGPALIGKPPWWQRAAGSIRNSLRRAAAGLPGEPRGLLPGLIDGDTSQLDPVLAERFRIAGLTHLVAVSGTNCSIVTGTVLLALRRARAGPLVCAGAGALTLAGFVVVGRPSPSVLRAALMAAIALLCLGAGRQRAALPMLSAAVLGLLLWRPELATDAGFTMSVLATGALLLLAPRWAAALRRRRVPPVVAESLAVAAAAHLVTAPVVAAISARVSIVAVPANVLAEPVVAATTLLGFCAALLAPLWLGGGALIAQLAGWPCRWLVWDANLFGGLHGATLPWPGGLAGGLSLLTATAVVAWLARRSSARRMLAAGAVAVVLVQIPLRSVVPGWPATGWVFVACDVGQGDALVLPAGVHSAIVVDAGPDPVAVDRCLRGLGVTDVALLVLSHYHLDHVGGLGGVFHGRHVSAVITGPLAEPESGVEIVQQVLAVHGMAVGQARVGQTFSVGGTRLDVLAPAAAFRGTRSDPNNSSLVVRATVAGVRILLPGDAEVEAQQAMLSSGADVQADVLKVPHHGSAYSDPRFLAAVHAQVGVVSVGAHNDYGHPSPVLLGELGRLGVPVRRTDRDGDVAIVSRAGRLSAVTRGRTSSVVGAAGADARAVTACHATMGPCLPLPVRALRPPGSAMAISLPSSRSSVMRSCSSPVPSSRSPPAPASSIRTATCGNEPAPSSTRLSCTTY